jgi:hypothetical protein
MPIDPQRFPDSDRPRVEVRRRVRRPGPGRAAATPAAAIERSRRSAGEAAFEPPTILPIVFPKVKAAVEQESLPPAPIEEPALVESPDPIDVRETLLGPSEMAVKEVPTLRYDAEELAPMLEEMAVRKVLLEQTLVRMRQALDEENEEIEREAAAIAVERTAPAEAASSSKSSVRRPALGAFFWLGSTVATALLGWGTLWLLRGVLFDPALLRTGGVLALFGLVALASNAALHLDALLPRGVRAAS